MLNKSFWEKKYQQNETGWNIGKISSPLKNYFDNLKDKSCKILIPGCGYGHEAKYLLDLGFENVSVIDLSATAIKTLHKNAPNFNKKNLHISDFFEHKKKYDLIIEQTFFCAIDPTLRNKYVSHCHQILNKEGKITGLFFNKDFGNDHPPFGGSKEEYLNLFQKKFMINTLKVAEDSIESRKGTELFFEFQKF